MGVRLVLDTNVWLDWLVFHDSSLSALQAAVASGRADIVINDACESELRRVLGYPLQKWTLDAARQAECLAHCRRLTRKLELPVVSGLPACADPDDQRFLELAAASQACCLLTRDRELLAMARRRPPLPFHIVTPAEFSSLWRVESSN